MFGLFKKTDPRDKLEKEYRALLQQAFELGKSNRAASDLKRAEAEAVLREMEALPRRV